MEQNFDLSAYNQYREDFFKETQSLSEPETYEYISSQMIKQRAKLTYLRNNHFGTDEEHYNLSKIIVFLGEQELKYVDVKSEIAKRVEQIAQLYKSSPNKLQFIKENLQLIEERLQQSKNENDFFQKQLYIDVKYYLICRKEEYLRNQKLDEIRKNFVQKYHEEYLKATDKKQYIMNLRKKIDYEQTVTLEQYAITIFLNEIQPVKLEAKRSVFQKIKERLRSFQKEKEENLTFKKILDTKIR